MLMLTQIPTFVIGLLVALFVVISAMLMLVVLIQRPQGGGLSEAFGAAAAGSGNTAFGAKTGDALTTATIGIFVLFIGFAVGLNYIVKPPQAVSAPAVTGTEVPPPPPVESGAGASAPVQPAETGSTPSAATETPSTAPAESAPPATEPAPAQPTEDPKPAQPQ